MEITWHGAVWRALPTRGTREEALRVVVALRVACQSSDTHGRPGVAYAATVSIQCHLTIGIV